MTSTIEFNFGEIWKYGMAFSYYKLANQTALTIMDELKPRKWYSICLTMDFLNETLTYIIDKKRIHKRRVSREIIGDGSVFFLNGPDLQEPFYGEITDVNKISAHLTSAKPRKFTKMLR